MDRTGEHGQDGRTWTGRANTDRTGEHKVRALHAGPCPLYPVGANLVFVFPVSVRLPYLCSPLLFVSALV